MCPLEKQRVGVVQYTTAHTRGCRLTACAHALRPDKGDASSANVAVRVRNERRLALFPLPFAAVTVSLCFPHSGLQQKRSVCYLKKQLVSTVVTDNAHTRCVSQREHAKTKLKGRTETPPAVSLSQSRKREKPETCAQKQKKSKARQHAQERCHADRETAAHS